MKLAFIIDPLAKLDPGHDTTVALMEATQALGHEVWVCEMHELSVIKGQAWATLHQVKLTPVQLINNRWIAQTNWYEILSTKLMPLGEMNGVWMRKDPPVTVPYLYATYILDLIPPSTLVLNNPEGLRNANEKAYAVQFQSVTPATIITQEKPVIQEFLEEKGAIVLKPLGGKAGEGILFLQQGDRNFNSLIEISTKQGQEPIMVQEYLPSATEGDKRIILLDGEPIGAVNRIPTGNEFRGNMAVGGRIAKVDITEKEREICRVVAPKLKEDGLYFVGLDVIGGYLTEVNVTSPTGVREINLFNQSCLEKQVIEWIEKQF
jgi:glutathione synthase